MTIFSGKYLKKFVTNNDISEEILQYENKVVEKTSEVF